MKPVYDQIGEGYTKYRRADRRIVDQLVQVLGLLPPATIADIASGTGNYSRALADMGFQIEAVEPSAAMRSQAIPHAKVRWNVGTAEKIPLSDNSVDGVVCVLAVHHFSSMHSAAAEMVRVCGTGPIVWLTFDPREADAPWLADYFPIIWDESFSLFPALAEVCSDIAIITSRHVVALPFMVPYDLEDFFMAAGWRRPEMYLNPEVRDCMSAFALANSDVVDRGVRQLKSDLQTGKWTATYGDLLNRDAVDWGYWYLKAT
jgi:ubiquinone/menaquinone biosynthesis C-methylase UbiE